MKRILHLISEYAQILLGIALASIGLKAFLLPNGFLDGGVTGIAILLSELYGWGISLSLILISLPFLLLAWFTVARKNFFKSIASIGGLAIFLHFENFEQVTDEKLLICIFGGVLLGWGIGLAIKNGAVLDGSEILGIYIHDKWGISIGRVIFIFNLFLFSVAALVLSLEIAMYSVLTYLITAKSIDFMIKGLEDYVGLTIVSEHSAALEQQLMNDVGTGITVFTSSRGYGKTGKRTSGEIIQVVINRIDIRKTYNAIDKIDDHAFVVEFDVNNIRGGVLRKYLSKSKTKELHKELLPS